MINHTHAIEQFVDLGIAIALVTVAIFFVATIDPTRGPYGLLPALPTHARPGTGSW